MQLKKDECGIAHMLEHMAFKGTENRNAEKIAREIEDVGGDINAYTSKEVTAYYLKVLRGKLFLIFVINSLVTIIISGLVINSFLGLSSNLQYSSEILSDYKTNLENAFEAFTWDSRVRPYGNVLSLFFCFGAE